LQIYALHWHSRSRHNAAMIPLIDISSLRAKPFDATAAQPCIAQLSTACRDIGFFYATGHGISAELMRAVFAQSHALFALPVDAKQKMSIKHSPHNRGYVGLRDEQLDPTKPADEKEAFNIGLDLAADHPEVRAGKPFRGVNQWPDEPGALSGFRATMLAYFNACWAVGRDVHRALAHDLGVAADFFEDKLDAPLATLRLLHYPALHAQARGLGAGEHTDYGNLTLLATDSIAGLQVRQRDGTWLEAPHVEGALICNIGDCLMRWTNDVYVSTPHRVLRPAHERYSVAFFLDPNPDARVEVLPTCVSAQRPARYAPTTGARYIAERLDATYQHRQGAA
jgi:isopenicillin N synthase-like dioxygenase